MKQLRTDCAELRMLFLDASTEALLRRFESLRRPHPLQGDGTILGGIAKEHQLMTALLQEDELSLDTSEFNVHDLSTATTEFFTENGPILIRLNLMSFGFKYGVPQDANFMADVRFIPNPHWVPGLR